MAEKIFIDFMNEEKVSVIKEKARQAIIDDVIQYLTQRYETVAKTASNEFGVVVGCAKDEDGFSSDVIVTLKASTHPWYNKSDLKRPVRKYRLYSDGDEDEELGAAEAYEIELAAKKAPKK